MERTGAPLPTAGSEVPGVKLTHNDEHQPQWRWRSFNCNDKTLCSNLSDFITHWGRVTHVCVGKLTIIGSDNGLSPGRHQAIIWANAGILLIGPLGTNFSEILSEIQSFSFKKMHLKVSSAKWRPFCLGLNELICWMDLSAIYLTTRVRNLIISLWQFTWLEDQSKHLQYCHLEPFSKFEIICEVI